MVENGDRGIQEDAVGQTARVAGGPAGDNGKPAEVPKNKGNSWLNKIWANWTDIMAVLLVVSLFLFAASYKLANNNICEAFCSVQNLTLVYADGYKCGCAPLDKLLGPRLVLNNSLFSQNLGESNQT